MLTRMNCESTIEWMPSVSQCVRFEGISDVSTDDTTETGSAITPSLVATVAPDASSFCVSRHQFVI